MTATTYILDSALVLIVLLQIKERELTTKAMIRPFVILGIAVSSYFTSIPTAGNDLLLIGALAILGALIGVASGQTLIMRAGEQGSVLARAGWGSAFFWVLGMGGRFAFAYWSSHGGMSSVASFSSSHSITSGTAWTDALLAMAGMEVVGRTGVMAIRRAQLRGRRVLELA